MAREAQRVEMLRLPYLLDNRFRHGGDVVSLMCQPPFTPTKIPGMKIEKNYYSILSTLGQSAEMVLHGLNLGL
jgi:hypothetical protein